MGGGLINWLFAIPAIYTIDTFGRRNLLLVGFPSMAACLIFTAGIFTLPEGHSARIPLIMVGLYLFMACYSPSEGPVPFTYRAEAFPLHIRDIGMSSSTAITWGFNFIISLTSPPIADAFGDTGGFLWYAGWNLFGWVFCYFMLPETKGLTLEELDSVFNVRNADHAGYYTRKLPWYLRKYVLHKDVEHFPPLYAFNEYASSENMAGEKPAARHSEGGVFEDAPERRVL
jgi:MFS family permease